jgi:dolichyl-phosphate-mannose-protein mannosyltransferase
MVRGPSLRSPSLRFVVLVFVLNLISAALFIARVNRPVYDDGFNIFDVHNYAAKGVTLDTLRSQRNAPGPTSFVWMATSVRVLGGNELCDARIGALLSWVLLGIVVLLGARYSRHAELWYAALIASLVFPHSIMAAATVLTEGPALFFALVGALAWTEFAARTDSKAPPLIHGMLGCLFLGLAVTCRQYNLALLGAAGLTAALQLRTKTWEDGKKGPFVAGTLFSLALSLVPVLVLILIWKGIASPSMESGASYNMMYKASAGLNLTRPVIAALRVSVYLVPLTFPLMMRVKPSYRWRMLAISAVGGIAAGHWTESLLQPGPLNTIVGAASRVFHSRAFPFGLIAAVAIYNALASGLALWEERKLVWSSPPVAFSLLAILLFIGEQFGVGGNVPFYDRYVLQVAPFLGILAFALLPSLDKARLFALITLSFFSHVMLWRYAFMP